MKWKTVEGQRFGEKSLKRDEFWPELGFWLALLWPVRVFKCRLPSKSSLERHGAQAGIVH